MGHKRGAGALGPMGVHDLGPIWVPFGVPVIWGPLGPIWGPLLFCLGPIGAHFGPILFGAHLGHILALFWPSLL